jgi:demethoxyubiquinone hydroxylase (CLK1/Coq7/Cat5 family)
MTPREVIPAQISEEVETEVSTALNKMVDDVRRYEAFNNSSLIQQQVDRIEKLETALRELSDGYECCPVSQAMRAIAREALERKDD